MADSHSTVRPSSEATTAFRLRVSLPATVGTARAPTGAAHPAPRRASTARSAVTAARVTGLSMWLSTCASSGSSCSRFSRVSTASAPWPAAGTMTGTSPSVPAGRTSLTWPPSSRRCRPASARTTPSRSGSLAAPMGPSSLTPLPRTLDRRVGTLPRIGTIRRSGRAASSWAARRGEPVPMRAPGASSARRRPSGPPTVHRASRGSSRIGTAAMRSPGSGAVGRSFREWTARSQSPSSRAWRSAAAKAPVPPSCVRAVGSSSPRVRISTILTARSRPSSAAR